MNEIIKRVKSPTPKFFQKVIKLGLTLGVAGGSILLAPATLAQMGVQGVELPALVAKAAEYMAIIGAVAAALAKTTVDDKPKQPQ